MNLDLIPTWAFFAGTIFLVLIGVEAGYGLGRLVHPEPDKDRDSSASAAALGLAAFMLAFTFGIVSDRYDARKMLVREEANAVRTAYLRSAFLPESDRAETRGLFRQYLEDRLAVTRPGVLEPERMEKAVSEAERIHGRLWRMAVANARQEINSEIAALYIESLNEVMDVHALRVTIGVQARIPTSIWIVLCGLTVLGLLSLGYQAAVTGSKRSIATAILALAYAMVISVIASLDRPGTFIKVAQQPLIDLHSAMVAGRLDHER
jgi:hypothetical protein